MNKIITTVVLLGVGIVALFVFMGSSPSQSLQAVDFLEQYKKTSGAVLLDVRTPSEFIAGHIEKAINVDFENASFLSEIQKLDKTKTYFVYCRSGNRSGQAISLMRKEGISNIYELQGGIVSNQNKLTLVTP